MRPSAQPSAVPAPAAEHPPDQRRTINYFCDTASLTSVNLLRVLLAERGLRPEFKPLENYAAASEKDFVLLIGDRAIAWAEPA